MMLWGMTLQPGYEYTEFVDDEVRLSMASLECRPRKSQGGTLELSSHVVLKTARGEFLLCTLEKGPTPQQNLDLVLQPRERVTFSVEGTGIVHLVGYTSESPDEQQVDEDPNESLPPQLMPPAHQDEDASLEEQQEDESIVVKNEPESVVIPILEEALEDMDQMGKEETASVSIVNVPTSMQGPSHMQGNMPQEEEEYPYPDMSDEGWMQTPDTTRTEQQQHQQPQQQHQQPQQQHQQPQHHQQQHQQRPPHHQQQQQLPDPSSRIDPTFSQGRAVPGANVPSTSYSQSRHAGEGRHPATSPATTGHPFFHDSGEDGDRRNQLTTSEDQKPVVFQAVNIEPSRVKPSDVSRRVIHDPKQQHKQYRCRHCRKEFSDRSMYLVHETRHTGKTCFHCEFCMKPFANRSELKIHERYHTGEKPFECRYCHKRFETSGNCQKHQRCHTGEKPYACGICGKGFSDVSNLRKHERTHQQK